MSNNNSGKVEDVFKDFEKSDPPWASKNAQYQYEAIKKVLLPMLEAYISSKVNEARKSFIRQLIEAEPVEAKEDYVTIKFTKELWYQLVGETITEDRIRTLKKTKLDQLNKEIE